MKKKKVLVPADPVVVANLTVKKIALLLSEFTKKTRQVVVAVRVNSNIAQDGTLQQQVAIDYGVPSVKRTVEQP